MIKPDFSNYSGSQAIISSDRVINYAKSDGVYLFGKDTVGLSTKGTVNVDANEAILLDSQRVELGHRASELGNQVLLGNKMVGILNDVLTSLQYLTSVLIVANGQTQETTNLSLGLIADAAIDVNATITKAVLELNTTLSKTTYTT
jgi:hypothetical protein